MNDPVLERFERELARDRLADCMLFLGPSRQRLRELSRACAARLLEARGALEEHPDAVIFDPVALGVRGLQVAHVAEREGEAHSVEAALRYKPLRAGKRALLLFEVDRMTADAQAALLKTAEEPPAETHFLLTAVDPTPILPALLSRCRTVRVAAPSEEVLAQRAAVLGIEPDDFACLQSGLGRAEAVLELDLEARQELLGLASSFVTWLRAPASPPAWADLPDGTLAEQRESLTRRLTACLGWASAAYPQADPAQALQLDQLIPQLSESIGEIGNQISPSLVLERLILEVQTLGRSRSGASENTIS